MVIASDLRLFTVQDYHQLVATGILKPDERVELLGGQLFQMAPKGTAHSAAMTRIERVLTQCLGARALLRWQDPVQLDDFSEPEPDVAVVRQDANDYEDHHPTPAEIFWLMEVADTTLMRDREIKAPLYSRSQIPEYWLVNIPGRCLHVFREPGPAGYGREWVLTAKETLAPLALPDCLIAIGAFFRSRDTTQAG